MNKYIEAIKAVDLDKVKEMLQKEPKWLNWSEPAGKNALHYLCGVGPYKDSKKADTALKILKLLLKSGIDINSVHRVEEKGCDFFPATPLWYAYTRGRNEKLYKYLQKKGADPRHGGWPIACNDDIPPANCCLNQGERM